MFSPFTNGGSLHSRWRLITPLQVEVLSIGKWREENLRKRDPPVSNGKDLQLAMERTPISSKISCIFSSEKMQEILERMTPCLFLVKKMHELQVFVENLEEDNSKFHGEFLNREWKRECVTYTGKHSERTIEIL